MDRQLKKMDAAAIAERKRLQELGQYECRRLTEEEVSKLAELNDAVGKLTAAVEQLSAKPKEEPKEPEQGKEEPKATMDFSALADSVKNAIAEGFKQMAGAQEAPKAEPAAPVVPEEGRKTSQALSTEPQLGGKEKTAMELSAEIDNDSNLTAAQKWSKQLALWESHRDEFEQK